MQQKITNPRILLFFVWVALLAGPLKLSAQDYCEPSVANVSSNNWIVDVETTGGISNIDNPTAASEYTDYSDTEEISAIQGTTVNFSVSAYPFGSMCYARIWVDWNQDGDFTDAGETVFDLTMGSGSLTFTGSITVPADATTGTTRMRIRTDWYNTASSGYPLPDPCLESGWGEAEDYAFTVIASEPCSGTVTAGTLAAIDSICPSTGFSISITGATLATGMTSQWQKSSSATGPWTGTGATDPIYYYETSGITATTYYRYYTTCIASGSTDTSDVKEIIVKPGAECYCIPSGMSSGFGCSSWRIDDFVTTGGVTNISNTNTNCSSGSYSSFLDSTVSQYQGLPVNYSIMVEFPYGTYTGYAKMWIDWNQDGMFVDAEGIYSGSITSGTPLTGMFEVPTSAVTGTTRIRIKTQQKPISFSDPCVFFVLTNGEVEDYSFEVLVPEPCEDVSITSITLNGPDSICAGTTPFTINSEGVPAASGIIKTWESAPAGTGAWTTISGASFSYLDVSGITTATDYRFKFICTASDDTVISSTWTVDLSLPTQCYCIPTFADGCSDDFSINDVSTSGAIANISNLGTGCPTGSTFGYSDYRDLYASAYQGTIVNYNINLSSAYLGVRMWIDWNQDGDFTDAGELIYTSSSISGMSAPMAINSSFEVPYDAVPGSTGMRIRAFSVYTFFPYYDACYPYSDGETEDYSFNVIAGDPCDEVPIAGLSIEGPANVCAANVFTITSTGTPIASGLTRIWQQKTTTGDWTTISGATTLNYTASSGLTEAADFRYIVQCTLTGEADTSNVLSVSIKPPTECYCEAEFYGAYNMDTATSASFDYKIRDFIINGQTDTLFSLNTPFPFDGTGPGDLGGYTDYTVDTPMLRIPDLIQTGTYTGQIKVRLPAPYTINRVWIDYDDDGLFDSTEAIHTSPTTYPGFSSSAPDNFSFTMPADANPGLHRLRVRVVYLSSTPLPVDPCYTYRFGQTQDYIVAVQELKPCDEVEFPDSVAALSSPPNVCGSGDITLTLASAMPIAAGITYQWKSAVTATGAYTNVGAELPGISGPRLTLTGVSSDLYYKCYVLCEGEAILISSAVYVQSVDLDAVVLTTEDSRTCGPGSVTLTGSATDGSVFWYLEPSGGSSVWTGNEYVTPPLTATDTFYATGGAFVGAEGVVGSGTGSSSYSFRGPFTPYFGGQVLQYMYTAAQLNEAGISRAGNLTSIKFNCAQLPSHDLNDYVIKIKSVTTGPPLTWQMTGWTEVFSASTVMPTATGWYEFPFSSPFAWNGTDNIIIEVCFYGAVPYTYYDSSTGGHKYTTISGQAMYYHSGSVTTSNCATAPSGSAYLYFPNTMFVMAGCETERVPVIAYVRPFPAPINIGPDETICKDPGNGLTLDAGPQPATFTFLWDDGSGMQTRRITESGTYYAEVTNEYGCAVYDTVTKNLLDIPTVELGNDTTVCEGGTLTLNAGTDGTTYFWSTGASTPTLDVITSGQYTVLVSNADDCIALDTIDITVSGTMPSVASIIVTNMDLYTFNFEPLLPAHVVSYEWDFGDESAVSDAVAPTHTFTAPGSYTVTLTVKSECGEVVYTTSAHIVGVGNVSADDQSVTLYPNPAKDIAVIESKGDLKMKSVTVTNVLGQVMYVADASSPDKHQLELSRYASGIYTVRIDTDKGVIVRKFEIVK